MAAQIAPTQRKRPARLGTGLGLWLACLGAALQLVGLSWDAVMHALDPGLAAREDVFSIANPSHLLVTLGLGMTVSGLVWVLIATGWRRASRGFRAGRLVAAVSLAVLFVGMGTVALATGGTAGGHSHDHDDAAGGQRGVASGGSNVENSPAFAALDQILRSQGLEAALDRLEQVAAGDETILVVAHDYTHALGKAAVPLYGGAKEAFGRCRETFQSGCYHGVIEAHMEANPQLSGDQVADLCDASLGLAKATNAVRFQCIHGLGHGLTANYDHDIFKALRMCDALRDEWDRGSCYSGVFMENIIFLNHLQAAESGQGSHAHGADHKVYLDADDPLYPCNVLDERYKAECFVMQTSAILMFNGSDFDRAMAECDRAPKGYVHLCYQSIGRDVSSHTYRDPQRSLEICVSGNAAYVGYCLLGAAKNFIDVTWQIDRAVELCTGAPSDYKSLCYQAIGEQLANLHPEALARARECSRVERDFIPVCNRGAGLIGTG